MSIIKLKNLNKIFKSRKNKNPFTTLWNPRMEIKHSVKDISFEIEKGESVGFLGPNGAGKTTTIKMMAGLIYPTSGEVEVLGFQPFERKKDFLMRVGLVMGNKSGLNWDLSANQGFELYKEIYRIPKEKFESRVKELTELLEVTDLMEKPIRKLSLGERMKFELIGAILHDPEILFLDEPTIGLDIIAKKNIRQFLRKIQKEFNITLILTSHDMDDVEQVCDRVIIINEGEKVFDDSMEILRKDYSKQRFVKFIFDKKINKEEMQTYGDIHEIKDQIATFAIDQEKMPELIKRISSDFALLDIDISSTPLEEIIEGIFKGKK